MEPETNPKAPPQEHAAPAQPDLTAGTEPPTIEAPSRTAAWAIPLILFAAIMLFLAILGLYYLVK